jgi:hypothetical protein
LNGSAAAYLFCDQNRSGSDRPEFDACLYGCHPGPVNGYVGFGLFFCAGTGERLAVQIDSFRLVNGDGDHPLPDSHDPVRWCRSGSLLNNGVGLE